jgi:hypothetical protein
MRCRAGWILSDGGRESWNQSLDARTVKRSDCVDNRRADQFSVGSLDGEARSLPFRGSDPCFSASALAHLQRTSRNGARRSQLFAPC